MGCVYLGGPIGGLSWTEATQWRHNVARVLEPLRCLDPLRDFDGVSQTICNGNFNEQVNDNQIRPFKDFFIRDYQDVDASDALLFNFLGAKRKSIGSACEISRGFAQAKMLIVVMEKDNINEDHFLGQHFTNQPNSIRVGTLKEGVNAVRQFFGLPQYKVVGDD